MSNRGHGLKKCLYCRAPLSAQKRNRAARFCGDVHKASYYAARREERLNEMSPEQYIQRELDRPAPRSALEDARDAVALLERKVELERLELELKKQKSGVLVKASAAAQSCVKVVQHNGQRSVVVVGSRELKRFGLQDGDVVEVSVRLIERPVKVEEPVPSPSPVPEEVVDAPKEA